MSNSQQHQSPNSGKPGNTGLKRIIKASGYSAQGLRAAFKHEAAIRQELVMLAIAIVLFVFLIALTISSEATGAPPGESISNKIAFIAGSLSAFSINSIIEFLFETTKIRDISYNSFLPELKKLQTKRSEVSIEKKKNKYYKSIKKSRL